MPTAVALNDREISAVLAGLRMLQYAIDNATSYGGLHEDIIDISSNGGTLEPLGSEEIDELCERVNS